MDENIRYKIHGIETKGWVVDYKVAIPDGGMDVTESYYLVDYNYMVGDSIFSCFQSITSSSVYFINNFQVTDSLNIEYLETKVNESRVILKED